MEIVVASSNLHKVRELRELFKRYLHRDIVTLCDFPEYTPPSVSAMPFADSAIAKATHAATQLGQWVLGDDSGLVIPLFQQDLQRPERYVGSHEHTPDNRRELLTRLEGKPELERTAYYLCSMALAEPEGLRKCVTATCEGRILNEEHGNKGFGFDPLFAKHDYDKSFGELDDDVRCRISHRGKAFEKLLPLLEGLLRG